MIFICYISRLVPQQHRKKVGVTSQDISGMAKIIFSWLYFRFFFWILISIVICVITDISIAAVDLMQEMTDVESDEDNEDAINAFFDALVCITF